MAEPRVEVFDDAASLDRAAAALVGDVLRTNPAARVVPATGETPVGLYAELAARRGSGALDPTGITIVQLDEYLGLEPGDRRSLYGWMLRTVLEPLGIPDDRVVGLPTDGDVSAACVSFDRQLAADGGIDLAILGIGHNGHLGFNEPPSDATSPTRVVDLSRSTIEANANYWGRVDDVPTRAVTMGLAPLLSASTIVLLVAGERKHEIVHRTLEGPIEATVPASFLRRTSAEVTVVVDRAAWEGP